MLKTNPTTFSNILKLWSNVVNNDRVNSKFDDKIKNLNIISLLQSSIRVKYLFFDAKKIFNFL